MPVTLKQGLMKYKNGDGEFVGINSISETATEDQLAAINSAGTTKVGAVNSAGTTQVSAVNGAGAEQVAAVEAKGAATLASIPSDYTNLSNQVSDLKSALAIGDHIINGDTVEVTKNVPGTSGTGMNTFTNIILLKGIEYTFVSEGTSLNNVCSSTVKGQDGTTLATIGDLNGTTSKTKKYTPAEDIVVTVNHYCYATSGSIKDTITANVTVKPLDDEIEAVEAEKAEMPFAMSEFLVSAGTNHYSANDRINIFIKTGQKYTVKAITGIASNKLSLNAAFSDGTSDTIPFSGTASKDIESIGIYANNSKSGATDQYCMLFVAKNPYGEDLIAMLENDKPLLHQLLHEFRYVSYGKNLIGNEAGRLYPIAPIKSGDKIAISTGNGQLTDQTYIFTFYSENKVLLSTAIFGTETGTYRILDTANGWSAIIGAEYISIDKAATYPFQIEIGDTKTAYQEYRQNALVWQEEIEKTKYELSELPIVANRFSVAPNDSHSSSKDRLKVFIKAGESFVCKIYTEMNLGNVAVYAVEANGTDHQIQYNVEQVTPYDIEYIGVYAKNTRDSTKDLYFAIAKNPIGFDLLNGDKMAYPNYYNSMFATVIPNIIAHSGVAGKNGTSFIFITDIHWGSNVQKSPALVNHIVEASPVNKIIMGGDYITQYANKQNAVNSLNDCMCAFKTLSPYVYPIFGNHDRNSNQHESESYYLSKAETYAIINQWMNPDAIYGNDYFNFYFDDSKSKTRYICLDSGAQLINEKEITAESRAWAVARVNELPSDWHALFFIHWVFEYSGSGDIIIDGHLNGTYNPDALALFEELDTINSTANKATVEGIVVGHLHVDFIDETTGGIPIVYTDCDGYGSTKGTTGTITEQCFDVLTFDYANKMIYRDRVGRGNSETYSYE